MQLQVIVVMRIAVPGGMLLLCCFIEIFCQVFSDQIAKSHGRTKRDTAAGIESPHHARHIVADGEQPLDRLPLGVENTGIFIGD